LLFDGDLDLGAHGIRVQHERQEPVGRTAGDDLQLSQVLELLKGRNEVPSVLLLEDVPRIPEHVPVHVGDGVELRLVFRAHDLLLGKLDQFGDVPDVAVLEQRIREHGDERGRQAHGDAEIHAVMHQSVVNINKRNVGLGDRFEEPVLFQELVVLGMPHIGQVTVQHQRKITLFHVPSG